MQLNSKIVETRWDPKEGIWHLTIENPQTGEKRTDWAHFFVNGTGSSKDPLAVHEPDP